MNVTGTREVSSMVQRSEKSADLGYTFSAIRAVMEFGKTSIRLRSVGLMALALSLVVACDSDSITHPGTLAPSLVIVPGGGENQTGTVGTTLPLPLIVQVTAATGSPNGQILNFVVTSGGGGVFANVVQTGTPSTGPAARLSGIGQNTWTLGPSVGLQTVEARLVDPKTGATLTEATFHATAVAGAARSLKLFVGDKQSAVAGNAVAIAPAVLVTDQTGNPIGNVTVTFNVATGGGTIPGATQIATAANGIAVVGAWILGATAGPNTLTATTAGLAGSPLTFTATGIVGAATQVVTVTGDGQHGPVGSTLPLAPAVQVRDSNGNGVAGVAVTFTVTAGGGTMAGITSVTTLTSQSGSASVGWTLGDEGQNTLRATTLGLSGSPVIFGAHAYTPLYVANLNASSITVYEGDASGNVSPVGAISGASTGLSFPVSVVRDPAGQLYVTNYVGQPSITVYAAGATGNVSPVRTIAGANTGNNGPYALGRDATGQIYVGNFSGRSIAVFEADATGNASPARTITGANTGLVGPSGVAFDAARQLYVTNGDGQSITVYAADANGNAAPVRTISGPSTGLNSPAGISVDAIGQIYVANAAANTITVYAANANGDATPVRTVAGGSTGLSHPVGLTRDGAGKIYVVNYTGQSITVYAADASGNATPLRTISGAGTGLNGPNGIAF